jgi:hypothetical protein
MALALAAAAGQAVLMVLVSLAWAWALTIAFVDRRVSVMWLPAIVLSVCLYLVVRPS